MRCGVSGEQLPHNVDAPLVNLVTLKTFCRVLHFSTYAATLVDHHQTVVLSGLKGQLDLMPKSAKALEHSTGTEFSYLFADGGSAWLRPGRNCRGGDEGRAGGAEIAQVNTEATGSSTL